MRTRDRLLMALFKHLDPAVPETTPDIYSWAFLLHETVHFLLKPVSIELLSLVNNSEFLSTSKTFFTNHRGQVHQSFAIWLVRGMPFNQNHFE